MTDSIPPTIVSNGFCDVAVFYEHGERFSVLAPTRSICSNNPSSPSDSFAETSLMVEITMFFGLIFLLGVMAQSCSRIHMDWYRLIFIYILGTLGVPISIALGPKHGGFNRVAGFGVLVHNMAELFILYHIWRGKATTPSSAEAKLVVLYVTGILMALTLVPLRQLFFIAMFQGGLMDWTLVFTFWQTGKAIQSNDDHKNLACGNNYYRWAFFAALMHILSIQPLFFGFATSLTLLNGITVIFLIPTFILYMWFASADTNTPANIIYPVPTGQPRMDHRRNRLMQDIKEEIILIKTHGCNTNVNINNNDLNQRTVNNHLEEVKSNSSNDKPVDDKNEKDKDKDKDKDKKRQLLIDRVKSNILMDGLHTVQEVRPVIVKSLTFTFFNVLLVFFSPCYITASPCDN